MLILMALSIDNMLILAVLSVDNLKQPRKMNKFCSREKSI